jgi:hemerythrin-like domain-containing protein
MSRRIGFEELIALLVEEHGRMKAGMDALRTAVEDDDYVAASRLLGELDTVFRQHIADEEAQVLRLLIGAYGVKGTDDAIKVFRQHRPIYSLMEEIKKLSKLSPEELLEKEAKLKEMFASHAQAEEERVFPWSLSTYRKGLSGTSDAQPKD